MTIVDARTERPDETQVLFREARQRRTRRWLTSGIVAAIGLLLMGIVLGFGVFSSGGGRATSSTQPLVGIGGPRSATAFSIRPVLCYAPALTLPTGRTPSTGPLPACSPSSQLTTANLDVTPASNNVNGYTSHPTVPADPQFATYASTTPGNTNDNGTVLLPATSSNGAGGRYVLGPAGITGAAVSSASAHQMSGQWAVDVALTRAGSPQWDALAQRQFHAILGVVVDGTVVSAPITQPAQSAFTSFNGHLQISGSFSWHQAKALAEQLNQSHH
jgi:hypothetical protein